MKTRTEIYINTPQKQIEWGERVVAIGSCFAEVVGSRLAEHWVDTVVNPLGEMFNPLSIASCVERVSSGKLFDHSELQQREDLWFLYNTSDLFAATAPQQALDRANGAVVAGHEALAKAQWVVLTLGTSWVYEYGGVVVANCHKMPQSQFVRRVLRVDEIVNSIGVLLDGPLAGKNVILTVSPVRHIGDGLVDNSLSKALLRVAVEQIVAAHANVYYFPAYEAVVDDLRDYRYYGRDMVHPSVEAEEYVWALFAEHWLAPEALSRGEQYRKLLAMAQHRPLHPDSNAYKAHCYTIRNKAQQLAKIKNTALLEQLAHFGE